MVNKMIRLLFTGWRLLMTVLVVAGAVVLCGLGFWQLDRLNQRIVESERIRSQLDQPAIAITGVPIDPAALDYRRVRVRGTFDPSREILLRNRSSAEGATGYHLITPLRLSDGGGALLVDRGWIPLTEAGSQQRRAFAPPDGEVIIEGVARRSQEGVAGPQDPPLGPDRPRLDAWFRVNIPRIEQQTGYQLLPVFVEQQPDSASTSLPELAPTEPPGLGSHLSYAIQWFSFAVILVAGYLVIVYQQLKNSAADGAREKQQVLPGTDASMNFTAETAETAER